MGFRVCFAHHAHLRSANILKRRLRRVFYANVAKRVGLRERVLVNEVVALDEEADD